MKKLTLVGLLAFAACGQNAQDTASTTTAAAKTDTRTVQIRVRGMM